MAKPIMVEVDDEEESIEGRDTVDDVELKTPSSVDTRSSTTPPIMESLTASEDSETTRIYDINTKETRYEIRSNKPVSPDTVKFFAPKKIPTFPSSKSNNEHTASDLVATKLVKAEVRFWPQLFSIALIKICFCSIQLLTQTTSNDIVNKLVIEEEVVSVLPSVKKLANVFANSANNKSDSNLATVQRPKVSF